LRQKVQSSVEECAREILDDVPLAMRTIRTQLRKNGAIEISIPQFRTLVFINRRSGASLSDAAEHMGLTLPSMSAMIDGLVSRNLVMRRTDSQDRRRMTLTQLNVAVRHCKGLGNQPSPTLAKSSKARLLLIVLLS